MLKEIKQNFVRRWKKNIPLLFLFLVIPTIVFAKTQGGIELLSEKYPIQNYSSIAMKGFSVNPFSSSNIGELINGIVNLLFEFTKIIESVIGEGLGFLYSLDSIEKMVDKFSATSITLWDNLYLEFGVLLIVIAIIQIFIEFVFKKNSHAGRKMLVLFVVIGLSVGWFSNSSDYMRGLNTITNDIQGKILSSGLNITGNHTEIRKGEELEGAIALIRNQFFQQTVYEPFLLMNYGEVDINKIGFNRINTVLSTSQTEEGLKQLETYLKENEKENFYMSTDAAAHKFGIAFLSVFGVLLLGIPLLLISFMNLLLQILALGITIILPISILLSFLPSFSNSAFYAFGKLLGVFFVKIFIGLIFFLVFAIMNVIRTLIPATNVAMFFLQMIVIGITMFFMFKYRNEVIKFVTAGQVTTLDGNLPPRVQSIAGKGMEWFENLRSGVNKEKEVEGSVEQDKVYNIHDSVVDETIQTEEREEVSRSVYESELENYENEGLKQAEERLETEKRNEEKQIVEELKSDFEKTSKQLDVGEIENTGYEDVQVGYDEDFEKDFAKIKMKRRIGDVVNYKQMDFNDLEETTSKWGRSNSLDSKVPMDEFVSNNEFVTDDEFVSNDELNQFGSGVEVERTAQSSLMDSLKGIGGNYDLGFDENFYNTMEKEMSYLDKQDSFNTREEMKYIFDYVNKNDSIQNPSAFIISKAKNLNRLAQGGKQMSFKDIVREPLKRTTQSKKQNKKEVVPKWMEDDFVLIEEKLSPEMERKKLELEEWIKNYTKQK